jgi:hypothetical protein
MTLHVLKRWSTLGGALAALLIGTIATAQESTTTPPPVSDTEPGQEKLPPCPTPSTAQAPETAPPEATAQPAPAPEPMVAPVAPAHHRKHNVVFAPQEVSLVTGAGVGNYFGKASPGALNTGATWDARATFGAHSIIALEAGYVGGINQIDVPGETNSHLNSNGLDGDFRLQLPYRFQPYIFSGVGYNHMTLDNTSGNQTVAGTVRTVDDQVTIPAGAGFAAYLGRNRHATLDLRGTYRYIPDNGITVMQTDSLHQWTAQARVGYTF